MGGRADIVNTKIIKYSFLLNNYILEEEIYREVIQAK